MSADSPLVPLDKPLANYALEPAGSGPGRVSGNNCVAKSQGTSSDQCIDELLTQLLKISNRSPTSVSSAGSGQEESSLESLIKGESSQPGYPAELQHQQQQLLHMAYPTLTIGHQQSCTGATNWLNPNIGSDGIYSSSSVSQQQFPQIWRNDCGKAGTSPTGGVMFGQPPLSGPLQDLGCWGGAAALFNGDLFARQDGQGMEELLDINTSAPESALTPEEETAICALVPNLVRVSLGKGVRGVYLDRKRGLWRANWREDGKVRTKGFRIAQWGEHEARRKAVEVRKLMETRACFLRLKAVALGNTCLLGNAGNGMSVRSLARSQAEQYLRGLCNSPHFVRPSAKHCPPETTRVTRDDFDATSSFSSLKDDEMGCDPNTTAGDEPASQTKSAPDNDDDDEEEIPLSLLLERKTAAASPPTVIESAENQPLTRQRRQTRSQANAAANAAASTAVDLQKEFDGGDSRSSTAKRVRLAKSAWRNRS